MALAAAAAGFVASFCSDIAAAATGVDRVHTYIYTFIQWHTYLYQPTTSFCAVFLLFARHRQLQLQMSLWFGEKCVRTKFRRVMHKQYNKVQTTITTTITKHFIIANLLSAVNFETRHASATSYRRQLEGHKSVPRSVLLLQILLHIVGYALLLFNGCCCYCYYLNFCRCGAAFITLSLWLFALFFGDLRISGAAAADVVYAVKRCDCAVVGVVAKSCSAIVANC